MADKITKAYKVTASGVLGIDDDGRIYISVEDKGDVALDTLLSIFNNKAVKFSCSYDEEYISKEELDINVETGEVVQ